MDKLYKNLKVNRPQFDDSAVAVIITKGEKAEKYERLVAGEELLESRFECLFIQKSLSDKIPSLHLNLIEHLVRLSYHGERKH